MSPLSPLTAELDQLVTAARGPLRRIRQRFPAIPEEIAVPLQDLDDALDRLGEAADLPERRVSPHQGTRDGF